MKYSQYKRANQTMRVNNAIDTIVETTRVASIQLRNCENTFEINGISGYVPDGVKRLNDSNKIMEDVLASLLVLIDYADRNEELGRMRCLITDILLDYQKGDNTFEMD